MDVIVDGGLRRPGGTLDGQGQAALKVASAAWDYQAVAASQTDEALGATGAAGDYLARLIVTVKTAASGTVSLKDGSGSAIPLTEANTPIGVYTIELGAVSGSGAWKVTTGAGATVVALGKFT